MPRLIVCHSDKPIINTPWCRKNVMYCDKLLADPGHRRERILGYQYKTNYTNLSDFALISFVKCEDLKYI